MHECTHQPLLTPNKRHPPVLNDSHGDALTGHCATVGPVVCHYQGIQWKKEHCKGLRAPSAVLGLICGHVVH